MGGIFVCYHNTFKNFGFEYISLEDMEKAMYGDSLDCDQLFSLSMQLTNVILEVVTDTFPERNSEIFITRPSHNNLSVLVTPQGHGRDQKPRIFNIEVRSQVDGCFAKTPEISGDKKWVLDFMVNEVPYTPGIQFALHTFNRLMGGNGTFASERFLVDLRKLADRMRLEDIPVIPSNLNQL
jgi:Mitochondrial protein Pet127